MRWRHMREFVDVLSVPIDFGGTFICWDSHSSVTRGFRFKEEMANTTRKKECSAVLSC